MMIKKLSLLALIMLLFSCHNTSTPDVDNSLPVNQPNNIPAPQPITFTVDSVYPHDPKAFTQGLQFYNGKLYEGTGEFNQSTLRVVDIKTGKPEKEHLIPDATVFGEGITIFKNKIYQLTWQNHKIFVYNLIDIMHPIATYNWSLEGWGITNDGNNLIISDGSSKLYYVQPDEAKKEMKTIKILTVADNNGELDSLNELEYIDGYVFANRWYNNHIYKIDTSNGHPVGVIDLTGLLHQYDPNFQITDSAVLNGIAYDSTTKKLYITGKDWPKLFEIKLNSP
jgi:glutaminyl-peptide cyclotransferase